MSVFDCLVVQGSSINSTLPPIIDVPTRESDNSGTTFESRIRPTRELNRAVNDFEATFFQSSRLSQSSQISCLADALSNSTSSSGKILVTSIQFDYASSS